MKLPDRRHFLPALILVVVPVLWEFFERRLIAQALIQGDASPEFIVPLPTTIVSVLINETGFLLENLGVTLLEAAGGFVLGNVLAIFLAVFFITSRTLEISFFPYFIALRSIPIVAITPIFILLLGNGWEPKVAIATLITFFPTLVNMTKGLRAADPRALGLMKVWGANWYQVLTRLRFPSCTPYFFAAMRVAVPSSFLGATVAEWLGSNEGLGYLILIAVYQFRSDLLYASMVVAAIASSLAFFSVVWLEGKLVPWLDENNNTIGG